MPLDLFSEDNKPHLDLFADEVQTPKSDFSESLGNIPLGGGDIPAGLDPSSIKMDTRALAGKAAPAMPMVGATVGGMVAAPANILAPGVAEALGIGGGYLIGTQLENRLKQYAQGKPQSSLPEVGKEIAGQAIPAAEVGMGGPLLGKAAGVAGNIITKGAEKASNFLYESALKIPPSIPNRIRQMAIDTGIKGQYAPSPKGLQKLRDDITGINSQISDVIDRGAKAGETINTGKALQTINQLKSFYENVPDPAPYLTQLDEIAQGVLQYRGTSIPIQTAQKMKQAIYALERKHYGEMKTLQVEANKAIARGLKQEIVNQHPELANLNADDSALLSLDSVLERAVNRTRNYDVIRLGDTIMTIPGAVIGGPQGATAAFITKRLLESAPIKAKLAFAINKAGGVVRGPGFKALGENEVMGLPPEALAAPAQQMGGQLLLPRGASTLEEMYPQGQLVEGTSRLALPPPSQIQMYGPETSFLRNPLIIEENSAGPLIMGKKEKVKATIPNVKKYLKK